MGVRNSTFFTDDFGCLYRHVETETCRFWYPAASKKVYDLFMSWGNYDEWGSLKQTEVLDDSSKRQA